MICRHCQRRPAHQARGLCFRCYEDRVIRCQYPADNSGRRGVGNFTGWQPLPAEPVPHPPGTPAKVAAMAARAEAGEQLWHPEDAGYGE